MELRGVVGRIEWYEGDLRSSSCYVAAALDGYTVTTDETRHWRLIGRVINSNAFNLRQQPLRFVAPHDKGWWIWPLQTLDIVNGQATARLGQPISEEKPRALRATSHTPTHAS